MSVTIRKINTTTTNNNTTTTTTTTTNNFIYPKRFISLVG